MRIGIDCRLWSESGVGRYIRNLLQELAVIDSKNEYVLFIQNIDAQNLKSHPPAGGLNLKSKLEAGKWKIVKVNIKWHSLDEQIKFPQILNRENLDLMHFPYFSVPIFYNKPFIVTIHDLILDHFPTGEASTLPLPFYKLKQLGYKFVISRAVKKAKKIITVSNSTKSEIVDHFKVNPDKVVVTYEGTIENSKVKSQNSKLQFKIQNLAPKQYFLYVGNAYPHKNLDRLAQAIEALKPKIPDIKLILVGKEDYFYKRLKEKVKRKKLEENIIFFGEATDEELVSLYKEAKALVFPSLMEGFGLPAIEAMANKCLVLASDIPAFNEICQDSAVYFDPLNVNNISSVLNNVIDGDKVQYSNLIKKGFERVEIFQWKKMAEETLLVYSSIK